MGKCSALRRDLCNKLLKKAQPGSFVLDYFNSNWAELTKGREWQEVRSKASTVQNGADRVKLSCELYAEPEARIWAGPAMIRLVAILLQRPIVIFALQDITASQGSPSTGEVSIVHGQPVVGACSPPAACLAAPPPAAGKPWELVPKKCSSLSVTVYPHTAGLSILADGHMRTQYLSEGQAYHVGQSLPGYGQFFPSLLLSRDTVVLYNDGGTLFWLAYPPADGPAVDMGASKVHVGEVVVPVVRMDFVP